MKQRKKHCTALFWIAALSVLCSCSSHAVRPYKGNSGKFTHLVWDEEFNHDGPPDTSRWNYQAGFVRNHEEQYYTDARMENARVENGRLIIEARRERYPNAFYLPGSKDWRYRTDSADYTSACIDTQGKAFWKYGRIEVRAKLPRGMGVWPAIWTLGQDLSNVGWPYCGEIDIMEFVGHDSARIHGTVHYADPEKGNHLQQTGNIKHVAPSDAFHVYAVEWDNKSMDFYFDDHLYKSFKVDLAGKGEDNPFRKPQFLLLNLAIGGAWGGKVDKAIFPQKFIIDYVRVFQ